MSFSLVRGRTKEHLTLEVLAGAAVVTVLGYVSVSGQHGKRSKLAQSYLSKTGRERESKFTKLVN